MEKIYTSLGLMSGTSMDGIDTSIIRSNGEDKFEVVFDQYFEYDKELHKELVYINKDTIELNNKTLMRNRLISLLKSNSSYNKRNYKIMSLLKYNIDIYPEDIPYFIKDPEQYDFLQSNKKINDIPWKDSIDLFQDMNSLYIIYFEKSKDNFKHKQTRKIHLEKNRKKTRKNIY